MADTTQNQSADAAGNTKKESPKKDAPKLTPQASTPKASTPKVGKKAPQKKSKKRGLRALIWLVVALVLVGGGLAAGWPVVGPWVKQELASILTKTRDGAGLKPRPTQARTPPEAPEAMTSVKAVAPALVPKEITPPEPSPLAQQLDDLKARVNALSVPNDAGALNVSVLSALKAQVAALGVRIQALEDAQGQLRARGSARAASAQALLLATTQLRARLMDGSPYGEDLSALQKIAPDTADMTDVITQLQPYAATGVPRETDLIARYADVAKAIMRARVKAQTADQGWLGTLKAGLSGLITVRRTDPATITDKVERAVAVAQEALGQGDLNRAVDALEALQGPPADAAAPWLDDARARLDTQKAVETLYRYALVALSATGGA